MKLVTVLSTDNLTVSDGKDSVRVGADHPFFEKVLKALENEKTTLKDILDITKKVEDAVTYKDDNITFEVKDGTLRVFNDKGEHIPTCTTFKRRIISTLKAQNGLTEFSMKRFAAFVKKLYENPSYKVVKQLYGFLENNNLPIDDDGNFLAYKKVNYNYTDIHTGKIDNSIGQVVKMPRNNVEDDPNKTCSSGLHVCSKDYLEHFGSSDPTVSRIVIVKVDPRNVVSVPNDYDNAKMRVCEYKVIDEITDFDFQLAPFVFGIHKPGWLKDTMSKVEDFYKDFWQTKDFDWEFMGDCEAIEGNIALTQKFVDKVNLIFKLDKWDKVVINVEEFAHQPMSLITLLSQLDEESLVENKEEE